ncbi:nucleoside deaminase, partial [Corynebacterium sp. Q4381]
MSSSKPLRDAEARMRRAIAVAQRTPPGDVPVGAVVFGPGGEVLGE